MRFAAKTDLTYRIVLIGTILLLIVTGLLPMLKNGMPPFGAWLFLLLMWGFAAFCAWLWLGTAYIMDHDELIIRYGPFQKRIPLHTIRKVTPVKSLLASSALSVSRLEILYGKWGIVHIAPRERERFLLALKERCPQAEIIHG